MDETTFLQTQSLEYQRHASHATELRATLEQQLNMEMYKTIPREYQPKQLKVNKTSLTEEFTKKYNQLFFKHLEKVITSNQIELQLHAHLSPHQYYRPNRNLSQQISTTSNRNYEPIPKISTQQPH